MKTILLLAFSVLSLNCMAQTPTSVYNTPASGSALQKFVSDPNTVYAVLNNKTDKINAATNTVTPAFDKGASNANLKTIISNGKAILQHAYPDLKLNDIYNGTSWDTFSLNEAIYQYVIDGDKCYFTTVSFTGNNTELYESDFTKIGTTLIASYPPLTLVNMTLFNHELYLGVPLQSVIKKYASGTISVVDSSGGFAFSDYQAKVLNGNLYYSLFQLNATPTASYNAKIVKIAPSGTAISLYVNTTADCIYNQSFMAITPSDQILLYADVASGGKEYLYALDANAGGTPELLKSAAGMSIRPFSGPAVLQTSGKVLFLAFDQADSTEAVKTDLWATDGTMAGTLEVPTASDASVTDYEGGSTIPPINNWFTIGKSCGEKGYSTINNALWVTDGITAPTKVDLGDKQIPYGLDNGAGNLYFQASDAAFNRHIMKIDCDSAVEVVGINEASDKKENFMVYPNPTNGLLTISAEHLSLNATQITIYNLLGQLVYIASLSKNHSNTNLDLSSLQDGIYIIKTNNGATQRIVKK